MRRPSILPKSFDNPFITKLPEELEEKEFARNFAFQPETIEGRRSAPNRQRAHCLVDALQLRVALPRHWDLDLAISQLIRWSYTNRDPRDPRIWTELRAR